MKLFYSFAILAVIIIGCKPKEAANSTPKTAPNDTELTVDEPRDSTSIQYISISEMNNMKDIGDPYTIISATIHENELWLTVSYGGGCKEHEFELLFNNAYLESNPLQIRLNMKHHGNNDMCRSIVRENLRFDLKSVQVKGEQQLIIKLNGWEEAMDYNY